MIGPVGLTPSKGVLNRVASLSQLDQIGDQTLADLPPLGPSLPLSHDATLSSVASHHSRSAARPAAIKEWTRPASQYTVSASTRSGIAN